MGLDRRLSAVRLVYFLFHATVSNLIATAVFILTAGKRTVHPNSPLYLAIMAINLVLEFCLSTLSCMHKSSMKSGF